jgi:exopolyphosphatase / guanosine-5'-triphosphate,3'-diphosphate pyrophosphatase
VLTPEEKKQRCIILQLASKYSYDEKHATFVEKAALKIFDSLKHIHKLGHEERLLLSHSALLHDIGNFINDRKHNKYTKYIIDNDEKMDDYSQKSRDLISFIAYNHRKKPHKDTYDFPKEERAIVLKLSSILRVADALEYSEEEVIIKSIHTENFQMQITIEGVPPERISKRIEEKKDLFNEVFKLDVVLKI